ncbi:MAG: PfkB family carbohydrate kinase [Thermoguttaceae bacterium]|jgi:fructose-1-phosphate kinase PfkB-like protein
MKTFANMQDNRLAEILAEFGRLRIRQFRGLAIKPNQFKAIGQEKPPWGERVAPEHLLAAMAAFRGGAGARVCITRGAAGMLVSDPEPIEVPGVRIEGPIDPTGAGDSATAGAVAALAGGASLPEAALMRPGLSVAINDSRVS